jgi:hypothetical protein
MTFSLLQTHSAVPFFFVRVVVDPLNKHSTGIAASTSKVGPAALITSPFGQPQPFTVRDQVQIGEDRHEVPKS